MSNSTMAVSSCSKFEQKNKTFPLGWNVLIGLKKDATGMSHV